MIDWVTISSLATAAGTLALAVATFMSVQSANRTARASEKVLLAGLLPVLAPSRIQDPAEKIRFVDDRWVEVPGGRALCEATEDVIYLAISLQNVGQGLAVLDRWDISQGHSAGDGYRDLSLFRRLKRDIYVPAGSLGFWQGALRDTNDPAFAEARSAILERHPLTIDLLYGDHEGGQRTISRFFLSPHGEKEWMTSVSRHWRLDRPNPR
ncbi:hypothetical protein CCAX7_18100 [Capsulimonas corticalis]|uniref:Uncharacterized protein n=1 Tax=Capsulimonas corticalis TaxID=2219043 RepID=A0A402D5C3_9BACT|nr:hypothetical protein [Capsulimonas corticalis]BDI29759.1 hypothetical protein CCAX7_18100 [Capsulimonas corticalis]